MKKFEKSVDKSLKVDILVSNRRRGWRNWQTRRTKDPVTALGREGSSPSLRIK